MTEPVICNYALRTCEEIGSEIFEVEINLTGSVSTVNEYLNIVPATNTDQLFDRQQQCWPA